MRAVIYRADRPNVNGVTYPLAELERAVDNFNKKGGFVTREDYPPQFHIVDLEKVAAKVELEMEADCVVANIEMLDTPNGKIAQQLIDHNLMAIQPTATGTVTDGITSDMTISRLIFVPINSVHHLSDVQIVKNWINNEIDYQFYLLDNDG